MGYSDISFVKTDPLFSPPSDLSFNPNQYNFYKQVEKNLTALNEPINENVKQIQINTYYYKRYKSENQLLYFINIVLVFVIIISFIKKKFPFIDDYAYSIIIGTILALSILYIIYNLWIILNKDDKNYDEYNYLYTSNIRTGDHNLSDSELINESCLNNSVPDTINNTVDIDNLMSFL
jgi:hypothetical protein